MILSQKQKSICKTDFIVNSIRPLKFGTDLTTTREYSQNYPQWAMYLSNFASFDCSVSTNWFQQSAHCTQCRFKHGIHKYLMRHIRILVLLAQVWCLPSKEIFAIVWAKVGEISVNWCIDIAPPFWREYLVMIYGRLICQDIYISFLLRIFACCNVSCFQMTLRWNHVCLKLFNLKKKWREENEVYCRRSLDLWFKKSRTKQALFLYQRYKGHISVSLFTWRNDKEV